MNRLARCSSMLLFYVVRFSLLGSFACRDRNRRQFSSYFYSKGAYCTTGATVTSSYNGSAALRSAADRAPVGGVSQHGVAEPCTCLQIVAARNVYRSTMLCIVPRPRAVRVCESRSDKTARQARVVQNRKISLEEMKTTFPQQVCL